MIAVRVGAPSPQRLLDVCGPTDSSTYLCRKVLQGTNNEFLARAVDFLVARPFKIVLIVLAAWLARRLIRKAIRRFVSQAREEGFLGDLRRRSGLSMLDTSPVTSARRAQRAEAIGSILRSFTSVLVWSMAGLTIMGEFGIELGPLLAGAGVAGVALGFGAQSLVRDFLTGLFMLVEDQYGVGDVVDLGVASGTVEGMSLRTTRVRGVDGTVWHVPNGEIRRVGNKSQQWARALLDIAVAYECDPERAIEVIRGAAHDMWEDPAYRHAVILEEPEVWGVEQLGADGVVIRLVVKTKPLEQFKLQRELRVRIKRALDQAGIEIPFPQRTVWMRAADGGGPTAAEAEPSGPPGPPRSPEPEPTARRRKPTTGRRA